MEIYERVAEAVKTWRNVMLHTQTHVSTGDLNPVDQPQPNVLYLGQTEWREVVIAASRFAHRNCQPKHFNHLLVIRVHLENYLQVACVEGVE